MAAPVLVEIERATHDVAHTLPPLASGRALFGVARAGVFAGLNLAPGDVLICHGEPRHGDVVVLVARGHGRPRLGAVRGLELIGDAGERCHRARWQPAGRLLAVARRRRGRWVVAAVEGAPRPPALLGAGAAAPGQLSLFGAAA